MLSYSYFADYYDNLTNNVDYKAYAEYILELCKRYNHDTGITLDLACGTGSLTVLLKQMGVDIYGVDASAEMLSVAQEKALNADISGMLFLRQKMQKLDLYGTIDTCICTLDSINHVTNIENVQKAFEKVSFFMNPKALFIFDVNTLYKHKEILGNNTFVYDTEQVFCVWQNTICEDGVTVDIALDFFENLDGMYRRYSEDFKERAYSHEEICSMLEKAGFKLLDVFGEMTFEAPGADSQRNIYIAEKI
ncbi:MAG: class I SAM-dependent methyltransferase [Clostridia bacterium]|nr:class I SAM-dependent methyltransferase [Clostridia bacterium]MEE1125809.1 class I SAM-dependent methyltransferase [Acutalibacteraceae bacterium]